MNIDLTLPLGSGTIRFAASIPDLDALCPAERHALAETTEDFLKFAVGTIAPAAIVTELAVPDAKPDVPDVLRGVTGSRRQ